MGKVAGKSSNGLTDRKQSVLAKLRAVARARTEKEYLEKLDNLKDSEEWKTNSNLRNYMTKTWLPQHIWLEFPMAKAYFLFPLQQCLTEMGMGV